MQANDNKPSFPFLMFLFAVLKSLVDFAADAMSVTMVLAPVGFVLGTMSDFLFYGVFLFWKFAHGGSDKLKLGSYAKRAVFGWIAGEIPFVNLFDAPITVYSTWRKECKEAAARQAATAPAQPQTYARSAAQFNAYAGAPAVVEQDDYPELDGAA